MTVMVTVTGKQLLAGSKSGVAWCLLSRELNGDHGWRVQTTRQWRNSCNCGRSNGNVNGKRLAGRSSDSSDGDGAAQSSKSRNLASGLEQ
ncbi:hypothetical protein NL676_025571 [Syzygium grande]|nr:hypothetical protein NL676_025571 [Syzygium grande]